MKNSIIGKKYIPLDNSYAANLSYPGTGQSYLAGSISSDAKICKIVSEPYTIINYRGKKLEMINVKFGNEVHMVLYFEDCIQNELIFGLNEFIPKEIFSSTVSDCSRWRHVNKGQSNWLTDAWIDSVQDITFVTDDIAVVTFNNIINDEGIKRYPQALYRI